MVLSSSNKDDTVSSGRARGDARDYLAVALDLASLEDAARMIDRLAGIPGWLKVGSELFSAAGPAAVDLAAKSARVFLDLKFYDIPNTVARAVAAATRGGASLLTLHASGGLAMLRAAVEAAAEEARLDGVVSSPQEAAAVRRQAGESFRIVTPGIRPAGGERGDQLRVATPAVAMANGSSLLVMGRPIVKASDSAEAARRVCAEIEIVLAG